MFDFAYDSSSASPATRSRTRRPPAHNRTFTLGGGVGLGELTQFARQFSTLLKAGVPIVRALGVIAEMTKPGNLRNAILEIQAEVEGGSGLSEAMARQGKVFDQLFVSMVRAGEAGGFLGQVFKRLADFLGKSYRLRKQVIGAMIYPAAVTTLATTILAIIMVCVMPKLIKVLIDMGAPIPWLTQWLIDITGLFTAFWFLLPLVPLLLATTFFALRATDRGRYALDLFALYLPVFGKILKKSAISRFCRTLGELGTAGVPILDSLLIIEDAVGNRVLATAVGDIHQSIRSGEGIADPMRRSGVFDPMVVNMVAVGEESGELDSMLKTIADDYDEEVDQMVSGLMSLLEPFMIVGMGIAIGTIVIAVFWPIIEFITHSM